MNLSGASRQRRKPSRRSARRRPPFLFEPLESRLLLSVDPGGTAGGLDTVAEPATDPDATLVDAVEPVPSVVADAISGSGALVADPESPPVAALDSPVLAAVDPDVVLDGLDAFLETFADSMRENVLALRLPLVGDALKEGIQFIDEMREALLSAYEMKGGADSVAGADGVRQVLFDAWGVTKTLLVGPGGEALESWEDIDVKESAEHVQFNCDLHVDVETFAAQFDIAESVDFDTGFDVLSLDISGEAHFGIDFDWELQFGQLKDSAGELTEFYVDTTSDDEMELTVEAAIPDLMASGTFLHLGVTVTDEDADDNDLNDKVDVDGDGLYPSELRALFTIDIGEPASDEPSDGHLTRTELDGVTDAADLIEGAAVTGGLIRQIQGYDDVAEYCLVDLNLNLDLNYGDLETELVLGDLGDTGTMQLPHISADFRLAWFLWDSSVDRSDAGGLELGPDPLDRIPVVEFQNISLNLGQIVSQFAGPVLQAYQLLTLPTRPVLEWFNTPIPVLSDLAGDDSLTLAKLAGFLPKIGPVIDVLNRLAMAVQFTEAFPEDRDITFNFGGFRFFEDLRTLNELKDDAENIIENSLEFLPLSVGDQVSEELHEFLSQNADADGDFTGLRFPFLVDPGEIVRFILGGDASLIEFVVPGLEVEFSGKMPDLPIFPPFLYVGFGVDVALGARLGFGFDTHGITRLVEDGGGDPQLIFEGFYVKDTWGDEDLDLPELYVDIGVYGKASVEVPLLAEAGVRGGVSADIGIDLHDPDGDGRVRFSELQQAAARHWYCMFEAVGKLEAGLEAYVWVGLDLFFFKITIFSDSYTIASATIFDFDWACPGGDGTPPALAELVPESAAINAEGEIVDAGTPGAVDVPEGTLVLNMGPRAGHRADSGFQGTTIDRRESFSVSQEMVEIEEGVQQESIVVRALGYEQYFDAALVNHIYAEGGAGNDTIRILDSVVTAGTSGETVTAALYGDFRDDSDDGPEPLDEQGDADDGVDNEDKLYLGPGGGTLHGGDGNDRLRGGEADDILFGGSGDDHLTGKGGSDVLRGGSNSDTLLGGDGDDELRGGGEADRLFGGRGDDDLGGEGGDDLLKGEHGDDLLDGGAGHDRLLGGSGEDRLHGRAGQDELQGQSGNDSLWGGAAADILFGDGGLIADIQHGEFVGVTPPTYEGDDTIYGESDRDLIFGGPRDDIIHGGTGGDFIFGDGGLVASLGPDPDGVADDTFVGLADPALLLGHVGDNDEQTVDLLLGTESSTDGIDTLYGNEGDDRIFGGGGEDWILGGDGAASPVSGTDNDVLVGDSGQIFLAGDEVSRVLCTDSADGGHSDTIEGNEGDDVLLGGAGVDRSEGGTGDDRYIVTWGQHDVVIDRGGLDTIDFSAVDLGIRLNLGKSAGQSQRVDDLGRTVVISGVGPVSPDDTGSDPLAGIRLDRILARLADRNLVIVGNVENVTGTPLEDELTGDAAGNVLIGLAGDDLLGGQAGDDTLVGGEGADRLYGDLGDDTLDGGDGDDALFGAEGDDELTGGGGDDLLEGGVRGSRSRVSDASPGFEMETDDDTLDGGAGDDRIYGRAGDDRLAGGAGNDRIVGGAGTDTVDYSGDARGVDVNLARRRATDGSGGTDRLPTIEGIIGSRFSDQLLGSRGKNEIHGEGGSDVLRGRGGRDTLIGGTGDDWLDGEGGRDLYVWNDGDGSDTIDDARGGNAVLVQGSASNDDFSVRSGADRLIVEAPAEAVLDMRGIRWLWLDAGSGDDSVTIEGGAASDLAKIEVRLGDGDDLLDATGSTVGVTALGGPGNDELRPGSRRDHLDGGDDTDTLDCSSADSPVKIDLGKRTASGTGGRDRVLGFEQVIGSEFDDVLRGDAGENTLKGGGGEDRVAGRGGGDTLSGGAGADEIRGGAGDDTLEGGPGNDELDGGGGRRDMLDYRAAPQPVACDPVNGIATDGHEEEDRFRRAEGMITPDGEEMF